MGKRTEEQHEELERGKQHMCGEVKDGSVVICHSCMEDRELEVCTKEGY